MGHIFIYRQTAKNEYFYFRLKADEDGVYMFCLDNTFSRFSKKMVFFEIITEDADEDWVNLKGFEEYDYENANAQNNYDIKIEDMKVCMLTVNVNSCKYKYDVFQPLNTIYCIV